MLYRRNFI